MRSCRRLAAVSLAWLAGIFVPLAWAADTDLFFTGAGGASARPNVLVILDNTANWSPMFAAEKNALKEVLKSLEPDAFNLGLMMMVETGGGNDGYDGGYVRFAIRQFGDVTDDASIDNAADALFKVVSDLHVTNDKTNNAVYGLAMHEAYKYFKGGDSYSRVQLKRDYSGNTIVPSPYNASGNAFTSSASFTYVSPVADDCQQNHIIFISNGKGGDNASATTLATTYLTAEGGDSTAITLLPNGYQSNVADEWARFMARVPLDGEDKPVIYTHTLLVQDASAPGGQYPEDWTVLLKSMANAGKGTYHWTDGTQTNIQEALDKAFKEIQAVNSVFASSTLPINVNVRGTFLNQVYMGVFRPEAQGTPRWAGNLKLYKLAYDSGTQTVFLADQTGAAAEDQVSGFIKSSARSFWSASSTFWNQSYESGFYTYADVAGQGGASDSPDGDMVEKGGAAQRLRATFATDLSGRSLYTCIGCSGNSALTSFTTGNAAITAGTLGLSDVFSVSSLARSGSVATATTSSAHGFSSGDNVTIAGATPSDYNKTTAITVTGATTFTYGVTETPPASATGTLVGRLSSAGTTSVSSITRSSNTATVTTAAAHGFTSGQTVTISGANQPEYNIAAAISGVTPTTFTYSVTETPSTTINLSSARVCPAPSAITTCPSAPETTSISSASRTAGSAVVSVDTSPSKHNLSTGTTVLIEGLSPSEYNGRYSVTVTGNKTFTYVPTITLGPASPATGTISAASSNPAVSITSLTRSGGTVTGTTSVAHGWSAGSSIVISGANESAYNGTFTLATASGATFTFTVVVGPTTPASGSITATRAGTISRDELINWVRGQNRLVEDNASNNASHVRGYIHGDVLHSRPAVVNYNRSGQPAERDILVFYGANDGILHAVKGGRNASDGFEEWGYLAEDHFPALKDLFSASPSVLSSQRKDFFDGPVSVYTKDADNDDALGGASDKVWVYAAMRRGGRGIHALDVSDPDAAPSLLWKKTSASDGYAELGQSWSEVQPISIAAQTAPVVVFSLGYDATANDPTGTTTTSSRRSAATMGRGVMIADAETGGAIWVATPNASYSVPAGASHVQVATMTCAIASDVSAIDVDQNGKVDRLYVADTCANIWRINVGDADTANWTVQKLAALGGTGTSLRKFFFRPDVVRIESEPTKLAILIGSGDREAPFDTQVANGFYMIKDDVASGSCTNCGVTSAGLCERNTLANDAAVSTCTTNCELQPNDKKLSCFQSCLVSLNPCTTPTVGWKYSYPTTGEKTVNAPITLGGTVFFGTNVPQTVIAAQSCGSLGEARLYQVNFATGAPASDPTGSGVGSYYSVKAGGGFPPSPVGTVTTTDDGTTVEVVMSGPQIQSPPTSTLEKRHRIYWYKVIDR